MEQADTAHGPRAVILRAVALAVTCVAALVVVDWWAVHTVPGRLLDARSLRGALLTGPATTHALDHVLDVVSVTSLLAAVAGVLVIALVRLQRALGLAAVALLVGANTTTEVLKHVVLSRPYLGLVEPAAATANSLPSGHVTVAFSVAVALVLVLPPALHGVAAAAAGAFTLTMSIATMTAGWHRASDTIAACLVVGFWAALVLAAVALGGGTPAEQARSARGPSTPTRDRTGGHSIGTRSLTAAATARLFAGGLVAVVLLLAAPASRDTPVLLGAYGAGCLLTGGAAAAVLAGALLLRQQVPPDFAGPHPELTPGPVASPPRVGTVVRQRSGRSD